MDRDVITTKTNTSSTSSSSSSVTNIPKADENIMDGCLADAGYKVKSSDLRHVAQRLERLENVMGNSEQVDELAQFASDAVIYNPANMASWVDSLLSASEFNGDLGFYDPTAMQSDTWTGVDVPIAAAAPKQITSFAATEEDSGIKLVQLLVTCAESVERADLVLAGSIIETMQGLLTRVNTSCGIGKVAGYFIDALTRRIFTPNAAGFGGGGSADENELLYHYFYEACPYLKFAHFTANQAILEAFNGHDCVHVIDFNLIHGLQWPALIQALALRPGGGPLLRLTGIGPPSPDGRDSLREIGLRLAELARSVNVRFAFRGVAAARLEDVKPWMLQVSPKEAVAVNSIMQLHRLLGSDSTRIDMMLGWIKNLNPKIVTVVEQEADHNKPSFLSRFTEALYYYSNMFDSLEASGSVEPDKTLAEMYIQREICNVVCCEGLARVERHEPLDKWRARLEQAGFVPLHLGSNSYKQASMLLTLYSAEGYRVEEKEGCLTIGWHSRPLIAASAWQVVPVAAMPTNPVGITSST